jgi:dTDP-4-dehydrorhamnose reductase
VRILVTGGRGMLGHDLCTLLAQEHKVIGVDIEEFDITQLEAVEEVVARNPERVCHLAANTDVDGCELDPDKAYMVNGLGTRHIALACQRLSIPMLYISTDYVFDGTKGAPYREFDPPHPTSAYGRSKLAGEWFTERLLNRFFIVRTSWLYGHAGRNFVDTILRKAKETGRLSVVTDQVGCPTYTRDLAHAIQRLITTDLFGIYHVTNCNETSWFEFAQEILKQAGLTGVALEPTDSQTYRRPAPRPSYSVLDNLSWRCTFGSHLRPWQEALADYLRTRPPEAA